MLTIQLSQIYLTETNGNPALKKTGMFSIPTFTEWGSIACKGMAMIWRNYVF